MTILVKKVFISSKPTFVYLLCPPLCGPFSIQESAAGGLSYKVKKNVPWHILAPRAVACDSLHLRASAHLWRIFGTSVPFSDLISDISHTFSVLFPAILYIFRPALNLSPLNHQHAIQRIFEIFEIERDFKPSDSST